MTTEEAERQWQIHANEILSADREYQSAEGHQRLVGRRVALAYVALVGGLLAFCVGFYYWMFRFFWAIVAYVVFLSIAGVGLRYILKASVKNDRLGQLVRKAHDNYVESLMR